MLWLLDSLLLATLSGKLQPFSFRWHHRSYRRVDITRRACLGITKADLAVYAFCWFVCAFVLSDKTISPSYLHIVTAEKTWFTSHNKSAPRAETHCEIFTRSKRMLPTLFYISKRSAGSVSRLNVKSIPSYTSSACGLRQISPGGNSQRGGWMAGLI